MLRTFALVAASAAVLPVVSAQSCVYNLDSTPLSTRQAAGPLTGTPFEDNRRSQLLLRRQKFWNVPVRITDIGFAATHDHEVAFDRLEVLIGYTHRETLSENFEENFEPQMPPKTVLAVREHTLAVRLGQWTRIGFQEPFEYNPGLGNLVIQLVCDRPRASLYQTWLYEDDTLTPVLDMVTAVFQTQVAPARGKTLPASKFQICIDKQDLSYHGNGCTGTAPFAPTHGLTGSPMPGGTVDAILSLATPSSPAVLALGVDTRPPFPIDLTAIGMPMCRQYFGIVDGVPATTSSSGFASVPLGIPNNQALVASTLYTQYYVVAPGTNPIGLLSSNYGRVLIGK